MEEKRAFSQLNEIPGGGYSINKPGAAFNAPFRHDESHHDAVEAWSSLTNTFKSFDERMVLEWKEDIDALLVFAGDFRFWRTFDKMAGDDHLPETWREREIAAVKETGSVLEVSALAWLSHTYSGDDVLDQMVPCISELKNRRAVRLIAHFIATNAQATFMELLADLPHDRPISLPLPPRCRARFEKAAEIGGPKSVHRIINAFADVLPTVLWIDGGHDHLTPVQILNILHVVLLCSDKELNPLFGGEALNEQVYNRLTGFLLDRIHRSNAALGAADEARQLLIHLGTYGCHKDYTPQRNAIQCALDAYASNDLPLFISTSCAALPPLFGGRNGRICQHVRETKGSSTVPGTKTLGRLDTIDQSTTA
ncbi:hypothetical protein ABKN59_002655 [Abortiporus biennis]